MKVFIIILASFLIILASIILVYAITDWYKHRNDLSEDLKELRTARLELKEAKEILERLEE